MSKKLEKIKIELEKCEKLKNEYLAGWQRARADLINYKNDQENRNAELLKYNKEILILKILPILDNFEAVENNLTLKLKKDTNIKGILQIKTQFKDFLKNQGLEEIKCINKVFDPEFQEIIEQEKVKNKKPGIVIQEIQKGYVLNGKVVRPAKVKVSV
ncbi:MAG: nucleotide exchange factor GrpE [Candidatus Pacebacteria bacterium]|nr:nucleotide exchange factor GrpE [Candidatus Paceibacterota bacterium]